MGESHPRRPTRRVKLVLGAAGVAVLALGLGLGFTVSGSGSAAPRHRAASIAPRHARTSIVASVSSVTLQGSPRQPVFVVTGRGLHVPPVRPSGSPATRRLCRLHIRGNAGHDYGDALYVTVFAGPDGKRLYGAGRFHPQSDELDCIGLIVLTHSPRRISITFGSAYRQFSYPPVRSGQRIKVVVGSTSRSIVVRDRSLTHAG
jgi:hypothetical protein